MYDDPTGRRNASGYADPTYRAAAGRYALDGRMNAAKCVRAMLAVASAMGCDVEERIVVRDRETGEVSR